MTGGAAILTDLAGRIAKVVEDIANLLDLERVVFGGPHCSAVETGSAVRTGSAQSRSAVPAGWALVGSAAVSSPQAGSAQFGSANGSVLPRESDALMRKVMSR
jgi:NADPH:quinone reductase-like Zn-dependent oxidoreductase